MMSDVEMHRSSTMPAVSANFMPRGVSGTPTLGYSTSQMIPQFGSNTRRVGGQQGETVTTERLVSSTVLGEQKLGHVPEESVQYVEVPVIEEKIIRVPRKEYVEVERKVPRIEVQWVDRVVEIPQVQVVDKYVEVPQVQEIVRTVPKLEVVEVPREVVVNVPKIEYREVVKEVKVAGELIEVPKPFLVENKVVVPRYNDKDVATVVAQRLVPVISESNTDFVDVDVKEYNPYLVPVDVYVPKPIMRQLVARSLTEEHRVVDVPPAQFNALLKQVNTHITEKDFEPLFAKEQGGAVPVAPLPATYRTVPPKTDQWRSGYVPGRPRWSHGASIGSTASSSAVLSSGGGVITTGGGYMTSGGGYISGGVGGGVIATGGMRTPQARTYVGSSSPSMRLAKAFGGTSLITTSA